MPTLALVRHGQSLWNQQNRFTGWVDVPLTALGEQEARSAGQRLAGMSFDVAYTSALQRAQDTLTLLMETAGLDLPVIRDEALNERHYGDLQGLNKARTAERTLPFFDRAILGDIAQGKDVLVVAHGNSNRAIVMELDGLAEDEVPGLELATGVPLVYDLDTDGTVRSRTTLD